LDQPIVEVPSENRSWLIHQLMPAVAAGRVDDGLACKISVQLNDQGDRARPCGALRVQLADQDGPDRDGKKKSHY
jgi:hypothetical protein